MNSRNRDFLPAVPKKVNTYIERLLDKLNAEFDVEHVKIIPEEYSTHENCFMNVEEKVKRDGGRIHYGWAVVQSSIICEAERHAVWEAPDGELIDVTPRAPELGFTEIMFVSDEDFVYRGQLVDNVRLNITTNPIVDDYIFLCETLEAFYTYGIRLSDDLISVPEPGLSFIQEYETLKARYQSCLYHGITSKKNCICGNGMKYRDCHGKTIIGKCKRDLKKVDEEIGHLPRPLKP